LSSEGTNPEYSPLDLLPTADAVMAMFEGQLSAAAAVGDQVEALARAAEKAAERLRHSDGRLVYVGAGTSGRLAVLDGVELEPTFGWSKKRLVYAIAGGLGALSGSVENAEDDEESGRDIIRSSALTGNDVVIGVSASGTTPYTVAAVREASAAGALTIALSSNPDSALLDAAAHAIFLDTGDELVTGSTRMKAGTAQKIALSLLSTAIMIRLGRVYDRLMVDMRVSNRKLHARAISIVAEISGADRGKAESALGESGSNIKLAVLLAMGISRDGAEALLAKSGDDLRAAVNSWRGKRPAEQ
jgi:N-acetylmuramic acid 6-phosphate etherase